MLLIYGVSPTCSAAILPFGKSIVHGIYAGSNSHPEHMHNTAGTEKRRLWGVVNHSNQKLKLQLHFSPCMQDVHMHTHYRLF